MSNSKKFHQFNGSIINLESQKKPSIYIGYSDINFPSIFPIQKETFPTKIWKADEVYTHELFTVNFIDTRHKKVQLMLLLKKEREKFFKLKKKTFFYSIPNMKPFADFLFFNTDSNNSINFFLFLLREPKTRWSSIVASNQPTAIVFWSSLTVCSNLLNSTMPWMRAWK